MNTATLKQQLREANEVAPSFDTITTYQRILAETEPHKHLTAVQEIRLQTLSQLGQLQQRLGQVEATQHAYEQYQREAITPPQQIEALNLIGDQLNFRGQPQEAYQLNQQALQQAEKHQLKRGKARSLSGIGVSLLNMGRIEESLVYSRQALSLFWELNDLTQQRFIWSVIGVSHAYTGEIDKALQAYQASLRLARKGDNYEAMMLNNIGESYQEVFDLEQAKTYHERALSAYLPHEPGLETDLHRNLGVTLCALGDWETGLSELELALEMSYRSNQMEMTQQTLFSLAQTELEQGTYEKSRGHIQELFALAQRVGSRHHLAQAHLLSGIYQQIQGETAVAEQQLQQALLLAHETNQPHLIWQIHTRLAQITTIPDLALIHYRIAADTIERLSLRLQDEALRQKFLSAPPIQTIFQAIS